MSISHIYSSNDFSCQVCIDKDDPILEQLAEFRFALLNKGYEPIPVKGKSVLNIGWSSGAITLDRIVREILAGTGKPGLFNALYLPKEVSPKCNIRRLLCILPQDRGFPAVRMSESMRGNRSARRLPWDRSIHCSAC